MSEAEGALAAAGRGAPAVGARSDYVATLATELAVMAAMLVVFRLAASAWGTNGFGEYVLARRAITLVQPALLFGMGVAISRDIALESSRESGAPGAALPAGALLACAVALPVLLLLNIVPGVAATLFLGGAPTVHLVGPVTLAVAGLVLHGVAYAELRGRMAVRAVNGLQVVNLGVVPVAAFLWPGLTPGGVIALTGALWCAVAAGTVLRGLVARSRAWRGRPIRPVVRRLLRYGAPRVPGELGFVLLLALPVILTAHIAGVEAAGFVGLGLSLVRMAGALFAPLGKVLLPAATGAAARGELAALRRVAGRLTAASVVVPAVVVAAFLPFAPAILGRYLGGEFIPAATLVRIVVPAAVPLSVYVLLRNLLDALDVRPLNTKNMAIALVALGLVAGVAGTPAAIAAGSVAGFAVLGALTALDARRLLKRLSLDTAAS